MYTGKHTTRLHSYNSLSAITSTSYVEIFSFCLFAVTLVLSVSLAPLRPAQGCCILWREASSTFTSPRCTCALRRSLVWTLPEAPQPHGPLTLKLRPNRATSTLSAVLRGRNQSNFPFSQLFLQMCTIKEVFLWIIGTRPDSKIKWFSIMEVIPLSLISFQLVLKKCSCDFQPNFCPPHVYCMDDAISYTEGAGNINYLLKTDLCVFWVV